MKASNQFITRITEGGSLIKVLLNKEHNIYPYFHNGIHFFIYKDYWSGKWNAIESSTGSSIVEGYYTKKECLKRVMQYIDDVPDIKKAIKHQLDLIRSAKLLYVMGEDEYIAMGD